MAVDKNLFLYDLATVAILKNEAPYLKEWLDYHLLAGVEHFYLYDHESTDEYNKIIRPYVEKGLVTSVYYPGDSRQMDAYNEAIHKYRFFCRYMAVFDLDEFIFPKSNQSVTEVVDEILADKPNAAYLAINWHIFGSNGQKKADYSRGVLERFTRRAKTNWMPIMDTGSEGGNAHVKVIVNPRKVKVFCNPHSPFVFESCNGVNEHGGNAYYFNKPPTADKIVINHYNVKSREEFDKKIQRGRPDIFHGEYDNDFKEKDRNEVFDDGILKYRTARQLEAGGGIGAKQVDYLRLTNALIQNLFPATLKNTQPEFFAGKMETFLTCRKLAALLRENLLDKDFGMALEETALRAVQKTFATNLSLADLRLLIDEMPEILTLEYPVVEEIRETLIQILPQMMHIFRVQNAWREFRELEIFLNMLRAFEFYEHD